MPDDLGGLLEAWQEISATDLYLHFLMRDADKLLSALHAVLAEELARDIARQIGGQALKWQALAIADYNPSYSEEHTIERVPIEDLPEHDVDVLRQVAARPGDPAPRDALRQQLRGYSLTAKGSVPIVFLMRQPPSKVLLSDAVSLIIYSDARLTRARDDALVLSFEPDCVMFGDYIYVFNKYAFESLFGYLDELRKQAKVRIANIMEAPLFRVDESVAARLAGDTRRVRRLSRLTLEHLDRLTVEICVRLKEEYGLTYKVEGDRVVADTMDALLDIIKIVDDNLVRSALTDYRYEASVKNRIEGGSGVSLGS